MKISVNGKDKEVRSNLNVHDLLIALELNPAQAGIAVAVDREVIPQTQLLPWTGRLSRKRSGKPRNFSKAVKSKLFALSKAVNTELEALVKHPNK